MFLVRHKRWYLALTATGTLMVAAAVHSAPLRTELVLCAADTSGAMRVLVLMPPAQWPRGGFQVRRGGTVLGRIEVDAGARAKLEKGQAEALDKLPARARAHPMKGASMIIYSRLLSDWDFARAAGMGAALAGAGGGRGVLKIRPLKASGKPSGKILRCHPGSAERPPAPTRLRAKMKGAGPALYWQTLRGKRAIPVLSFRVWRGTGRDAQSLTKYAPFLPPIRKVDDAAYIDLLAPLEQLLTYQVAQVDVLGRVSPRARVEIYTTDLAALRPPAKIKVRLVDGGVDLSWAAGNNPHTSGYVVERAFLATGPFELLTPKGLPADQSRYHDTALAGGTVYYYRVRSMGPRGDLGPPSDPVAAQPRSTMAPPAPQQLRAEAGNTRVRLRWAPLPAEVAGYIIERRADGSPAWSRINQELWPATRYDDPLGPQTGGTLNYRVTAVSQDNRQSPPSAVVQVKLRDTTPPLPPRIVQASGTDGRVRLQVQAARPVADTLHIYVLRGGSATAPGLVIGKPLNGTDTRYEDRWVKPGQTYWYHLVAYDAAGNRSAASDAVSVRVGAPPMPQPDAPQLHFESQPLPRVIVQYAASPQGLDVLVQRSEDGQHWQDVAGPATPTQTQDLNPAKGGVYYRIRYRAANDSVGPASASVKVRHD